LPDLILSPASMARLMPLFVLIDAGGGILDAGPTLIKVLGDGVIGRPFLSVFKIDRPRSVKTLDAMRARQGTKIALSAQEASGETVLLRAMPIEPENGGDSLLIDLTFGANFSDVVTRNNLTSADFRPSDLTIDLLYTFETQRALLKDSEDLAAALTKAKVAAEDIAMRDLVTGLANRRALHHQLEDLLSGQTGGEPHALLLIDLDKFKAVNDNFGHAAGDAVLQNAADCIETAAGPDGFAARIGGDEFALE